MENISLSKLYQEVTLIIVTFKSHKIINQCLNNLDPNLKKIVVENSNDKEFTKNLENTYDNLKAINIGFDSGYGYALNRGIEASNTNYIISINPDTFPEKNCINKIYETIQKYKDTAIVTPITIRKEKKEFDDFGYFKKNTIKNKVNNILEVDWVNGNIFILDMKLIKQIGMYDENFFLQWEERDFQKRIFDINKKILIDFDAKSHHLEGQSHDPSLNYVMKCEVSWHHGWSKFYFYKKHYGYLNALSNTYKDLFIYLTKSLVWFFLFKFKKANIYRMFFLGIINSMLMRKSFYRAEI
ncbi:glycosyltransferase family 2 protein [Candidatus Pelagibacter sp.]|uniref:glycosyltransferase family 2 protein n=1 Tax=Candidatus Pelagibacter sp. TaxID=2024849 RepID=UPI003F8704FB